MVPASCQHPPPPHKEHTWRQRTLQREPTSLREAAARCNGVSQTVSFALTLAPEEEQREGSGDREVTSCPRSRVPGQVCSHPRYPPGKSACSAARGDLALSFT